MSSDLRRAALLACGIYLASLSFPSQAQEADREWIPFVDPGAQVAQPTAAVSKSKTTGGKTVGVSSVSGTSKSPWDEYDKAVQGSSVIGALGPDLFGDHVEYYKNTLSFSVTDINLPGNSALPVELTRKMEVVDRYAYHAGLDGYDHPLQDWDLELPNISGVYASNWSDTRCSSYAVPQPSGVSGYSTKDFWNGLSANMPGGGEMLAPRVEDPNTSEPEAAPRPANGVTYPWMTAGFTYFRCLGNAVGNGTGEGFEAITTDGTKYTFSWLASNDQPDLQRPPSTDSQGIKIGYAALQRRVRSLYVTRVEDRFGNFVTYSYDNDSSASIRLRRIEASDGRVITLDYTGGTEVTPGRWSGGYLSTASAHGRTWTYQYTGGSLSAVILPDATRWTYDFSGLSFAIIEPDLDPLIQRNCNTSPIWVSGGGTGIVTHPSGAIGKFTVAPMRYGRSNVPKYCDNWAYTNNDPNDDVQVIPRIYLVLSISKKEISGPGIMPFEWVYSGGSLASWTPAASDPGYQPVCQQTGDSCFQPVCVTDDCAGQHVTSIIGQEPAPPGGQPVVREFQRLTFGNSYHYNEGKLLRVERGGNSGAILNTDEYIYNLASSGQTFAIPIGTSLQLRQAGWANSVLRPQKEKKITRDGATFRSEVLEWGLNGFARPTKVKRYSTLPFTPLIDEITYKDYLDRWVVGQVATTKTDGIETSQVTFDEDATGGRVPTLQPAALESFQHLDQIRTYNSVGGALTSVTDGNNKTTTFANWKRGIPQLTTLADQSTTISAVVDDWGQTTQVTDENGKITNYGYDAMGRLWLTDYTDADTVLWNSTIRSFGTISSTDYGMPTGTWKHTASTGTGRTTTWYNARWQPQLVLTEDTSNVATRSYVVKRYDSLGRRIFTSYPVATLSSINDTLGGVTTSYDGIGRVTETRQSSELGNLLTITAYLAPFKTQVTNPRGKVATTEYQAFDTPSTDAPVTLVAAAGTPEQQTTAIVRDRFGKPLSITRSGIFGGANVSAARSYVYDAYERLCKIVEPESGSTLFEYDGNNNVIKTATGQALPALVCNPGAVDPANKTVRTYDVFNRVKTVDVPGTDNDLAYTYNVDGTLQVLTNGIGTNEARWDYEYNWRRMPKTEKLTYGGRVRTITHEYNANGIEYRLTYPSGQIVNTVPNALGQATQAATFATGVTYFPNGGMSAFTYGNGIVHSLEQNARKLPSRSLDQKPGQSSILDEAYTYDANGNVASIDSAASNIRDRSNILYDGLDRLLQVDAPGTTWKDSRFTYDPLDNLRSNARDITPPTGPTYLWTYNYDTNNRLASLLKPASVIVTHDTRGNMTSNGVDAFVFDVASRLTRVCGLTEPTGCPSGGRESYFYDGHGRRVGITSLTGVNAGKVALPMYSLAGQLITEEDNRSNTTSDYIYLNGSLVAKRTKPVVGGVWTTTYLHTDALGSPVVETDASAVAPKFENFTPYGEQSDTFTGAPLEQGPKFDGHVTDASTGLSYMQQRYYDPQVGRFLSIDPVDVSVVGGSNFNRYAYAANNPYRYYDPDGRCTGSRIEYDDGTCKLTGDYTIYGAGPYFPGVKTVVQEALIVDQTNYNFRSEVASLAKPNNTVEAAINRAIMRGDTTELRIILEEMGGSELSAGDLAAAEATAAMGEGLTAEESGMLADRYGVYWANKVHHVFEGVHQGANGNALLAEFGTPARALVNVQKALEAARPTASSFINGTRIQVGRTFVEVKGAIVDGVYKIGTVMKW